MSTIVEATAKKLSIDSVKLFRLAALDLGFVSYQQQASIWLAQYVETRHLSPEVTNWLLNFWVKKKGGLDAGKTLVR